MNLASVRSSIKYLHPAIYRWVARTRPVRVQVQTTSICNADCDFCPYPVVSKEVPMGNMSQELFEKVVRDGLGFGIRKFALYLLNEPFVDPHIVDRIERIAKEGAETELSTNGSLTAEEKGRKVFKAGLTYLAINMPSVVREEYEKIVTKLDFDTVMRNVDAISRYHREYKTHVLLQVNVRPGRDPAGVQKTLQHWKDRGLDVKTRVAMDWAGNVGTFSQNIHVSNLGGCSDFREVTDLHVLYNGDVILCCEDWRRTTLLGNAREDSLEKVYFGRPYFEIRKKVHGRIAAAQNFICRSCEFAVPRP